MMHILCKYLLKADGMLALLALVCVSPKDVLFLALDCQHIIQGLFRLWHTASLYCRHL